MVTSSTFPQALKSEHGGVMSSEVPKSQTIPTTQSLLVTRVSKFISDTARIYAPNQVIFLKKTDADHEHPHPYSGPVSVYLAKVDNAVTTGTNGLKWFKIAQDGFDTSSAKWGVDHMIENGGWQYFTMPTCVAPGQYLMRAELLALHSAYSAGGAQFYVRIYFVFSSRYTHSTYTHILSRSVVVRSTLQDLDQAPEPTLLHSPERTHPTTRE